MKKYRDTVKGHNFHHITKLYPCEKNPTFFLFCYLIKFI